MDVVDVHEFLHGRAAAAFADIGVNLQPIPRFVRNAETRVKMVFFAVETDVAAARQDNRAVVVGRRQIAAQAVAFIAQTGMNRPFSGFPLGIEKCAVEVLFAFGEQHGVVFVIAVVARPHEFRAVIQRQFAVADVGARAVLQGQ